MKFQTLLAFASLLFLLAVRIVESSADAKTQSSTEWRRRNSSLVQLRHSRKQHHHNKNKTGTVAESTIKKPRPNHSLSPNSSTPARASPLSPWTPWSKCSKDCRQSRHRTCSDSKVCGHVALVQDRPCRKGRCGQRQAFHVVLPPKRESLKHPSQSDVRVLLSLNSIFYSSWSRWSPCTKACTTTRYRTCRFPVVCGSTVLHEEAYCYSEGTDCEKWYSHRNKERDYEEDEDLTQQVFSFSNKQPSSTSSATSTDEAMAFQQCGMSSVSPKAGSAMQLRIIGGREAAPGKWPWQVAILNRFKEAFCGGTLIGTRWVLTAAHCLRKRLYVRVGEYDLVEDDGTEVDYRVEEVFVHPDYDPETVDNDVALLRLPEPVSVGSAARLACLPRPQQPLPSTQKCTIIGWGKERSSHVFGTEVLHEAEVPIVKTSACREVYDDYYITDNMFCAGYRKGRIDSCAGDSGGPLLCQVADKWTIFGITSFGEGCGKKGKYGIYTKVPNYVAWIKQILSLNQELT